MNPIIGISIIIALVGLFIKSKTYHAPFEAFLKIDEFRIRNIREGEIKIHNYGPDVALNIIVKSRNITIINSTKVKNGFYKIWNKIEKISGEGPQQLENGDSQWYAINDGPSFIYPTVIKWKTKKGKVQKSYWRIQNGQNIEITQTNFLVHIFYAISTPFKNLKYYLNRNKLPINKQTSRIPQTKTAVEKNDTLENKPALHSLDQAAKIIGQDKMEGLKFFAIHLTKEHSLETAIKGLLQTDNIETYTKQVTGKEVNVVEHIELDDIKEEMNQRGFEGNWSEGIWPRVKKYDSKGEGLVFFRIIKDSKKEKKVIINIQGLDILNSYHAGFKKETSNSRPL